MGSAVSSLSGPVAGLLGGAFSNQKEGATDAGNAYGSVLDKFGGLGGLGNAMAQGLNNQTPGPQGSATANIQNDPILSGTYGQGGTLDQTRAQETQQANQPWALTDEDKSAYGQASGNIARQFGQNDQSLSQSLSDRGLSDSGVAGAAFSGAQGNKNEQLAGLQTQIANNRQQMNMQRLGQTQNFLSQLGQGANTALNNENSRMLNANAQSNQAYKDKFNMAQGLLGNYQNQQNTGLEQQQGTAHGSTLGNMASGMAQGMMSGGGGGGSKSGGGPKMGTTSDPTKGGNYAGADMGSSGGGAATKVG